MFDPGVLVDDGRVYLFVGFCMPGPVPERFRGKPSPFAPTSLGFELEPDMMTIRRGPVPILPGAGAAAGTGFEGHGPQAPASRATPFTRPAAPARSAGGM